MTTSEIPPLNEIDFDAGRMLRLTHIQADGDDEASIREYARRVKTAVPNATSGDLMAVTRWLGILNEVADLRVKLKDSIAETMEPLGFVGKATIGEVLEAIPAEWSERDDLRRQIVISVALDQFYEIVEAHWNGELDAHLDRATDWALGWPLHVGP